MIASNRRTQMQRTKPLLWASVFLLVCSAVAGDCLPATILLSVLDRNFEIRNPNFRNTDLRVKIDNKPVQILSISRDSRPRRIVLMVDTSGSMEASRQRTGWGITLPAAAYAVDVLPESASAALVTFSDKLRRESNDFETRHAVGRKVLDLKGKQPHGGSLLFDCIRQVLIDFTQLQFGDSIYVVTDGGENGSKTSLPQLRQELISRGIRIFCFLVRRNDKQSDEEVTGASRMEDLAEFTGGTVVRISAAEIGGASRGQLQQLAPSIIGQAESFYRVELGIPSAQKAGRVQVSFVDKGNANIAYSHQIGPCSPTGMALN
jgi:VWA domain containing CoxE-like protein